MSDQASAAAQEITQALVAWRQGDPAAASRLFELVYRELRGLARRELRRAGRDRPLETTSLVHEAFIKLVHGPKTDVRDRGHFFAIASKVMRRILVDHARERGAQKRGGGRPAVVLDDLDVVAEDRGAEIVAVDSALERLEALDPRLAQIVEMRFFGGLSVDETADALGVSPRTVRRDWQKARALLMVDLAPSAG